MNNDPYYLAFASFDGIGPFRFSNLMKRFNDVQEAYKAPVSLLRDIIGPQTADQFHTFRQSFHANQEFDAMRRKDIEIITREDKLYPPTLQTIYDPPICLFIKGKRDILSSDNFFFAVVGTRKPTAYGMNVAKHITGQLAQSGMTIVSGMALGIDTIAHTMALDNGTPTIAVLGCGVDIMYPPSNRQLYQRIIDKGIVMSEFPPGRTVLKGLFVSRNRIVSALSRGVLVIEGTKVSGSLITARCAAEQGRDVFAIPGPITSTLSEAPHILLREGAKMVMTAEDIFQEYQIKKLTRDDTAHLSPDEQTIYEQLRKQPFHVNDLIHVLGKDISSILPIILNMEMAGVIEKNREGMYQIR